MKQIFKSLILAVTLSIGLFFTARSFTAVPNRQMWVSSGDINGLASVYTDRFSVSFEGHTFGSEKKAGVYTVDGRIGGPRIPWSDDTLAITQSDGVEYGYSPGRRLFTLKFQNHKVEYSHPLSTLKVDGKEFSTGGKPIRVVVKKNGQISTTS
jgi:hypothetical protein